MGYAVMMVIMVMKGFGVMVMVMFMKVKVFRVVGFRRSMVDEALVFMNLWFWQEVCKRVNLGARSLDRFRQEVFMGYAVVMVIMVMKGFWVMVVVMIMKVKV